ncbi:MULTISPECIES: hypothetical protein [Streptomyces]|uniref:hypothetical protein n=1 Tax=Streptomyces TaxID=1883 RepID=UPI00073E0357|nr:hypothetical protein [Streptomyces sp. EAS-AB2608]MYU27209.1 hypothetical protein [Streptomyces sp. SID7810]BCM72618.1 hypothetical protein EASAB2608_07952 [Streptomyces sp. EAS-AB2608]CUW26050.1 hypothetical protein TUE45_00760 [Streptomyces reticuli]
MRRFRAWGIASAVALLAWSGTETAVAASGVAFINGVAHQNPQGCYSVGGPTVHVVNFTDTTAKVYPRPNCAGAPESWISPGAQVQVSGASVSFD